MRRARPRHSGSLARPPQPARNRPGRLSGQPREPECACQYAARPGGPAALARRVSGVRAAPVTRRADRRGQELLLDGSGAAGAGEMDVLYRAVGAGGESPHLPAVYRRLYGRGSQ